MASIKIAGLTKRYGESTIIDQLDLDIAEGEFVTLLGPSGCGKTTTLRCIAGLEDPEAGLIQIGSTTVYSGEYRTSVPPERRDIGMMFQSYALWPHLDVGGNVAFPLKRRKVSRADIVDRVRDALKIVDLAGFEDRPINSLSGGQQQRVALARTIVAEPRVLLFDEPLSNLDAALRETMRAELRRVHDRIGTTSIYVTHDQTEAITLSDRVVVMNGGRVEQDSTPRELYERPRTRFVAGFVGIENFLRAALVGSAEGARAVRIEGTDATVALPPDIHVALDPAAPALIAFRAQGADIRPRNLANGGALIGTVKQRTYVGDGYQYRIGTPAGDLALRSASDRDTSVRGIALGDEVDIVIRPEHVVVLPHVTPA
jgi:ABC-type Fe3+/spermidine/putrescine transport system ATPase subunit